MNLEISTRSNLALTAIRLLHAAGKRVARPELAEAVGTTPDFLARVVAPLVKAGWVDSSPGRKGGYSLAIDPALISVLDLIESVEGVPSADRCVLRGGACNRTEPCALHDAWLPARDSLLGELRRTSVIDRSN